MPVVVCLALPDCVEVSREKRGGIPVLKGTRFTAAQVLAELADDQSVADLCDDFQLDAESVVALLHAIAAALDKPIDLTTGGDPCPPSA